MKMCAGDGWLGHKPSDTSRVTRAERGRIWPHVTGFACDVKFSSPWEIALSH